MTRQAGSGWLSIGGASLARAFIIGRSSAAVTGSCSRGSQRTAAGSDRGRIVAARVAHLLAIRR